MAKVSRKVLRSMKAVSKNRARIKNERILKKLDKVIRSITDSEGEKQSKALMRK